MQTIELASATEGAEIYYAINKELTYFNYHALGTKYNAGDKIVIDEEGEHTLFAIAIKDGCLEGAIAKQLYNIKFVAVRPTIDLKSGKYEGAQTITMTTPT